MFSCWALPEAPQCILFPPANTPDMTGLMESMVHVAGQVGYIGCIGPSCLGLSPAFRVTWRGLEQNSWVWNALLPEPQEVYQVLYFLLCGMECKIQQVIITTIILV